MSDISDTKPPRQATACNWCRQHKLKCDVEQPSCRNCRKRNVECITTDLRRPDQSGRRTQPKGRRVSRKSSKQSSTPLSNQSLAEVPNNSKNTATTTTNTATVLSSSASPSPPPSPTDELLATIHHDSTVPSIFAVPFQGAGRRRNGNTPRSEAIRGQAGTDSTLTENSWKTSDHHPAPNDNSNVIVVTDKSRSRFQMVGSGSSIYVMAQWLDLFFVKSDFWKPIYPFFQQGLAFSVEVPLPFLSSLPQLPSSPMIEKYVSTFFTRIHPIYPIIDRDVLVESISNLRPKLEHQPPSLSPRDYPALACIYAVFSISADEEQGGPTQSGTHYLEGAYFLYAHLVAMPYVTSVQALLLLTIILRHRNKDAACLGTLGQAIRIAQSIGLHRRITTIETIPTVLDLHSRIWWTAYILERTMELETGRPSAIRDSECDQVLPRPVVETQSTDCSYDYFCALIKLAQIQNRILHLYYSKSQSRKTKDLLFEMGRIDRALMDWAGTFPEEIRPGRDIFCPTESYHLATYVTLQYHQTTMALHRPALMSATAWLRNRVGHLCAGTPWKSRLRYCLCIGAASARASLKAMNDLLLYSERSRLITANQIMLSVLVLAIYVTRIPTSRMNESDLAIVCTFAEEVEQEYLDMGQDAEFARGLSVLRDQLTAHVSKTKMDLRQRKRQKQLDTASASAAESIQIPPSDLSRMSSCVGDISSRYITDMEMDLQLEESPDVQEAWPCLWTEDLSNFYLNDPNQDMLSAYLLGLPQVERG